MRLITILLVTAALSFGVFWVWENHPGVKNSVFELISPGKFQTLEIRYTAEKLMEKHKWELLKDSEHSYLEPVLKFHPYLLMEVKYNKSNDRTGEGVILWSLVDGEMVINTNTWEKTHGFTDCISAGADKEDFKILNALATRGGATDRESLCRILNVENDILDSWIDICRKKSLIVQAGNNYRLHLQNPKLQIIPETKLDQWLVTKQSKNSQQIPKRFSSYQIEKISRAAFGNDFAIRKKTEIFLPVYSIIVQNPDGSQMTTYWNALNGKKLSYTYLIE